MIIRDINMVIQFIKLTIMYMFYDFIDTKLTNALTSTYIRER